MIGNIISLPINDIKFSEDNEFDKKVVLKVCKEGLVPSHNIYIEKSSIEGALESIYNRPILCAYEEDENGEKVDFKGHEMEYIVVKNGNKYDLKVKYIEQPVGITPESCNPRFETIDSEEWLVADGILYKEYCEDAIRILEESNGEKCVSMEIKVTSGEVIDKVFHITGFKFKGVTLLGDLNPPAITGANCTTFSQNFSQNYDKMLEGIDNKILNKGGDKVNREEIVAKFEHLKSLEQYTAIVENVELSEIDLEKQLFSLSVNDLERRIREELKGITCTYSDYWGDTYECQKYYLVDVLTEEGVVIIEDNENWYKNYGVAYSLDGDKVVLDVENAKRYIRGDWRLFEEGMEEPSINPIFEEINTTNKTKAEEFAKKFEKIQEEVKTTKVEFTELQTTKVELEKEVKILKESNDKFEQKEKEEKVNEILENFSELSEVEGYNDLFEKRFEMELTELEKELKVFAFDNKIVLGNKPKKKKELEVTKLNFEQPKDIELTEAEKRYGTSIKKYLK